MEARDGYLPALRKAVASKRQVLMWQQAMLTVEAALSRRCSRVPHPSRLFAKVGGGLIAHMGFSFHAVRAVKRNLRPTFIHAHRPGSPRR